MRASRYLLVPLGVSLVLILFTFGLLPRPARGAATSSSPSPAAWRRLDDGRLLVTFSAPAYRLEKQGEYDLIVVPGFDHASRPGTPQLPSKSVLVAVPPEGAVGVRIVRHEWQELAGTYRLAPAPQPAPLEEDLVPGSWAPAPPVTPTEGLYPATPVEVSPPAWIRGQRVVRLTFFPFQYESTTGRLRRNESVHVEITFQPTAVLDSAPPSPDDPFDVALRQSVLNAEMVNAWRVPPDRAPLSAVTVRRSASPSATATFKIVVDRDGLYRLTYNDLVAAGLDPSVDPRTFALTNQGQPVAIRVEGEEDGSFDPGDAVIFYGQRFRGELMARRYAALSATWLSECPACRLDGLFAKYTDENVYWLSAGGTPGPRMATITGTPAGAPVPRTYRATVRAEEANHWWTHHFGSEDTWFWDRLQPRYDPIRGTFTAVTRTYAITLTGVVTAGTPAQLRAEIGSRTTSPGHRTRFYFNDSLFAQPVYSETWDGRGLRRITATLPVTRLQEGQNRLTFVLGENTFAEDMYFNWFEVEYDRRFWADAGELTFAYGPTGTWQYQVGGFPSSQVEVYDITDPFTPTRVVSAAVTGSGPYTVAFQITQAAPATFTLVSEANIMAPKRVERFEPSGLKAPSNGADYIIITHRAFMTAAQRLADYRASQGLRTMVVDVAQLYDEFNDGIYHPMAIRNFLAYAYANWQPPAPTYVVLVGDGNWNFKNDGAYGQPPIYMPPNLAFVDPWQGEVDSANLLAAFVGDDILPDVVIARLPAATEAELNAMIDKTIAYEAQGWQPWRQYALFVADDVPDTAGDFVGLSEGIIDDTQPPYLRPVRIYLNDFITTTPGGCRRNRPCPAINRAITETMNVTGALFLNFVGHASVQYWAGERLFTVKDVASLDNGDRLPILLSMTCLDGYWIHPSLRPSLVVELLRAQNRGIVAAFSPTGLGVATGHDVLQRAFYETFFAEGTWSLAQATLASKLAIYASGANYDLINTFTIFGDPALRVPSPFDVELSGPPPFDRVAPGSALAGAVTVTNTASTTDTVTFAVTPTVWSARLAPVTATLAAGSSQQVTVTLSVPPTAPAGTRAFTITATSLGDRRQQVTTTLRVSVWPRLYLPVITRP